MAKLVKIGDYWVNVDNVAYVRQYGPFPLIVFNAITSHGDSETMSPLPLELCLDKHNGTAEEIAALLNGDVKDN